MTQFLNAKMGGSAQEYSLKETDELLRTGGVAEEPRGDIQSLLDRAAAARFAPASAGNAEADRETLLGLLGLVDQQWTG